MTSFFIRLQEQNDAIADWNESTVKKLRSVLNRILRENDYKDSMMDILLKFMSLQDGKTLISPPVSPAGCGAQAGGGCAAEGCRAARSHPAQCRVG